MNIDQQGQHQNALILEQAIAFAGKYARTFDPELLDHWYRLLVEQTLPANASHAELAANNAVRHFVVNIIRQYQLATTGRADTPWQKTQALQQQTQSQPTPQRQPQPRAAKASQRQPRRRRQTSSTR